jgi:hypothetical protein
MKQQTDIDKGQVALKQVQSLQEIPLGCPNQIGLHSEGKDVIPNEYRTRRDCGENEKN